MNYIKVVCVILTEELAASYACVLMFEALLFETRNANTNILKLELAPPCNEKRSLFIYVRGSENVYSDVLCFLQSYYRC